MRQSMLLIVCLWVGTLVRTSDGGSLSSEAMDALADEAKETLARAMEAISKQDKAEGKDTVPGRVPRSTWSCPFAKSQQRSRRSLRNEAHSAQVAAVAEGLLRSILSRLGHDGNEAADAVLAHINQRLSKEGNESCGFCPVQTPSSCDPRKPYREPDGSCNNLENPQWGQAYSCERRILPAGYQDGVSEPRVKALSGNALPSARLVSFKLHPEKDVPDKQLTHLAMAFGQFLDHDISFTPTSTLPPLETFVGSQAGFPNGTESFNIDVPPDDPFYSRFNRSFLNFTRSLPCCHCQMGPRDQMNSRTSFIDGSQIYGISKDIMDSLRTFDGGLLKYGTVNDSVVLPPSPEPENDTCSRPDEGKICSRTGDFRSNQNPGLVTMHTLFLREHNRIARKLAEKNPDWNDDVVFQTARRIVVACLQNIVYNEYLPVIVGPDAMTKHDLWPRKDGYTNYDSSVDATIINEFSTAAFRFGHSNIQGHFDIVNENGTAAGAIRLKDIYFQPFEYNNVTDGVLRGFVRQPMQATDRFGDPAVTNFLFRQPGSPTGNDLFAIDIQRGRDHGIQPYADYVKLCRSLTLETFADLTRFHLMPEEVAELYSKVYEDVRDIDFFSAGLNEPPVTGAAMGATFVCLVADMFGRLKRGDRFYYEHGEQAGSFTPEQLQTIKEITLAKIICENTEVKTKLQRNVFKLPGSGEKEVNCDDLPDIRLEHWAGSSAANEADNDSSEADNGSSEADNDSSETDNEL
ncbi:salivary peroxidase/catechol oxidase-like [Amblyomma americanum]